jgi:hypothetical protein
MRTGASRYRTSGSCEVTATRSWLLRLSRAWVDFNPSVWSASLGYSQSKGRCLPAVDEDHYRGPIVVLASRLDEVLGGRLRFVFSHRRLDLAQA